jgi:ElaB/YqjD/DUF883 family membrane-anchored ribosome-binding protein
MANTFQQKDKDVADRAKSAVSNVADKSKEMASNVIDKSKDVASNVIDRTKDVAHNVADRAKDMAHQAGETADNMVGKVGSGLEAAAGSLRDQAKPSGMLGSGMVGQAATKVADTLESSGRYLEEQGLSGMAEDFTELIKRNPIPALLIAVGVGFLIARATRS